MEQRHQHSQLWRTLLVLLLVYICFLGSANGYEHYRLPTAIQPDRYKLKVITRLENPPDLTFDGQVSMRFKVLEDTQNITLHSQNLTIDQTRMFLKSYAAPKQFKLCLKSVDTIVEQDYYIIHLCQTLKKDETYKMKLYFSGVLNEKLHGYYRSSYVVKETNETRWLSVTQFEPAFARAAFPCMDEPNYKARFVIWMGHHKSLTALSNMPLEKQMPLTGLNDYVWSVFEESVPMSTYLVAYTVNDFAFKLSEPAKLVTNAPITKENNVVFRTWARPEAISQCNYASEVGPNVLKYYEEIFGIPFPLKKVDEIAIPDFSAGAMENWGLVTYRETALLFAPNVSSESNKQRIASVIAHELAHQWFGNLVTMKWWTDLWLNEGFATYIASLGVHHLSPEWDSYNEESLDNIMTTFRRDAQISSHPISQPILNTSQIGERFDSISYKKGSSVLRMLHLLLGQMAFFDGVKDYLMRHEYKNAEQDDLWQAFTDKAHLYHRIDSSYNMKSIMDSWTLQTGYPIVKVKRDYKTGSVEISQQRFLENSTLPAEEYEKCWWVPLSYTTSSEMDFSTTTPKNWLECDESTGKSLAIKLDNVVGENDWIIFNIQLSGVYRVMYDRENWYLLNKTLNSEKHTGIDVMNRALLIDDVIWLAWSGYHDYNVTFDILEYLTLEREYLPWRSALDGLSSVNRLLKPFPSAYEYFKNYMRVIINPIYFHLDGLNSTQTDASHSQILHKALIAGWACRLELDDCVDTAVNYFKQWRNMPQPNEHNQIPVDLRPTVYCTAIRHGGDEDWQFLWQRYKESNVATEKRTIIFALGCSQNKQILRNYIEMTYDKQELIKKQDSAYAFGSVARNEVGYPLAQEYYIEKIDELYEFYGPHSSDLGHLLQPLAGQIINEDDLNKLNSLLASKKKYFQKSEKNVESALETINFNLKWIDRNVNEMRSLLKSRLFVPDLKQDLTENQNQD